VSASDDHHEECVCFSLFIHTLLYLRVSGVGGVWSFGPCTLTTSLTHTHTHSHSLAHTHMTTPTAPPSISLEDYLQDPTHLLTHSAVSHWSYSPYSGGAWSQLSVGGTPLHRRDLGEWVSERVVLAGEACHVKFPAMVSE
jgi:hypothetical protein